MSTNDITKQINDINDQLHHLRMLSQDYARLASGEYTKAELNDDITQLRQELQILTQMIPTL